MKKQHYWLIPALAFLVFGCPSGPGSNQNKFFDAHEAVHLPFVVEVDAESAKMSTGAITGGDAEFQAFMVAGLIGVLMEQPKAVAAIRGKFAVGEVFERSAKSLSAPSPEEAVDTLNLKIVHFQQYIIPGTAPRLQALMEFEAHLTKADATTVSGYACEWDGTDMALLPDDEKNMLDEMVEQTLFHWSKIFLDKIETEGSPVPFPSNEKGDFSGNGVQCKYDIFLKPSDQKDRTGN